MRSNAVSSFTEHELRLLGLGLGRVWPTEETPHFQRLLEAIDEADERLSQDRQNLRR